MSNAGGFVGQDSTMFNLLVQHRWVLSQVSSCNDLETFSRGYLHPTAQVGIEPTISPFKVCFAPCMPLVGEIYAQTSFLLEA